MIKAYYDTRSWTFVRLVACFVCLFASSLTFADTHYLGKSKVVLDNGRLLTVPQSDGDYWNQRAFEYKRDSAFGRFERSSSYKGPWSESSNGFKISGSGKLPVTATEVVPKAAALKGLAKNANKWVGGKLGWFLLAGQIIAPYLAEKGFEVIDDLQCQAGDNSTHTCYAKKEEKNLLVYSSDTVITYAKDKSELPLLANEVCTFAKDHMQYEFSGVAYWKATSVVSASYIVGQTQQFGTYRCEVTREWVKGGNLSNYDFGYGSVKDLSKPIITVRPLTQSQFDETIEPALDEHPELVGYAGENKGNLPEGSTVSVTVPDGSTAQSVPYRNPVSGKAEQRKYTFNTTNNNTRFSTVINNYYGDDSVEEVKPDDDDSQASEPDNADWPQASDPELVIPKTAIDLNFDLPNYFSSDGVCPKPLQFSIDAFGRSIPLGFSWDLVCNAFSTLRPLFISICAMSCMFYAFSAVKEL